MLAALPLHRNRSRECAIRGSSRARVHPTPRETSPFAGQRAFEQGTRVSRGFGGPSRNANRSDWSQITASPEVLTHYDYWSGTVVW
jgi:hypothetical protein